MKKQFVQPMAVLLLLCFLSIIVSRCNKESSKKNSPVEFTSKEMKGLLWRKELTGQELDKSILFRTKAEIPVNGTTVNSTHELPAAVNTECIFDGDIYTSRYEFTSCIQNQRFMNFYVQVYYGDGTVPEGIKLKIIQYMTATTTRDILLTTPTSWTQVEPNHREYLFVLNIDNFNICTEYTSDIRAMSSFQLRCPQTREIIPFSTTQTLNSLNLNCNAYNYTVTVSGNQASFQVPIPVCSPYGRCSVSPISYKYEYRIKGTTAWTSSPAVTTPYVYVATLSSGTYETRGYTVCNTPIYSPVFEFIVP